MNVVVFPTGEVVKRVRGSCLLRYCCFFWAHAMLCQPVNMSCKLGQVLLLWQRTRSTLTLRCDPFLSVLHSSRLHAPNRGDQHWSEQYAE